MGFADDIKDVREKLEPLMASINSFTDEKMRLLGVVSSFDIEMLNKIVVASEKIESSKRDILLVENGLHDIHTVAKSQNQVNYVSNMRGHIGVVAGSIDEIKKTADYATVFGGVAAMKPMIDEVLKLSVKMDLVLDLEEKMDTMVEVEKRLDVKLKEMRELEEQTSRSSLMAVDILNNINTKEHLIAENTKKLEKIFKNMNEFHVKVTHVGSEESASAGYDRTSNRLDLNIPMGKTGAKGNYKGDKGDPGKNGSNFTPSYMGTIIERNRFNSHAPGTSFLSLDEIPTMIYFRKSNTMNDWTDGQPFGVSNGGYSDEDKGVDIVDGINIDELTKHILRNIKRREDGSGSN